MPRCPICKKSIAPRSKNGFFPFCSPRCRLIDLGKWLGGEYRIAGKAEEEEDEMPAPGQSPASHDGENHGDHEPS